MKWTVNLASICTTLNVATIFFFSFNRKVLQPQLLNDLNESISTTVFYCFYPSVTLFDIATLIRVKSLRPWAFNLNLCSYLCPPSHLLCIDSQTIERSHRYRALYVCAFLRGFISIQCTVLELCSITTPIQVCLRRHPQESNILMIFTRGNCILSEWIVFQSHFIICSISH